MPSKYRRNCPVCNKPDLQYLSDHLRQVHNLKENERKQWLRMARFSLPKECSPLNPPLQSITTVLRKSHGVTKKRPYQETTSNPLVKSNYKQPRRELDLTTLPYPDFNFRHKFSLLVVGPSQSGKTHFVQQILEKDRIVFEKKRKRRILWCYTQWQEGYEALKKLFKKEITFAHGLPKFSDDLSEIDAAFNNIIILDDLMAEAIDSPMVSRLFTQGRHRNASVILLLQNMFPKGKYNTDISRNAQYITLFRSPSDRKQIGIVAERMFDKNRDRFMAAFSRETEKPFGYLLVDNKPDTRGDKQVIGDVFGKCHVYSTINKTNQAEKVLENLESKINDSPRAQRNKNSPSIFWSDAVISVWQNLTNNVEAVRSIPEGYSVVEMYKTSRNPYQPDQPGVSIGGENYWPVKLRHRSNGGVKWVNVHVNEPTIRNFVHESLASEAVLSRK